MKNFIKGSLLVLLTSSFGVSFGVESCDDLYNSLIQNKKQCSIINDPGTPYNNQFWCEATVGTSCTDTNKDWKESDIGADYIIGLTKGPTGSELRLSCWSGFTPEPPKGAGKTPNSWCNKQKGTRSLYVYR